MDFNLKLDSDLDLDLKLDIDLDLELELDLNLDLDLDIKLESGLDLDLKSDSSILSFLVAYTQLYKSLYRLVGLLVSRSVGPSVRHAQRKHTKNCVTTLPLPTHTRLLLLGIRPCLGDKKVALPCFSFSLVFMGGGRAAAPIGDEVL